MMVEVFPCFLGLPLMAKICILSPFFVQLGSAAFSTYATLG
jgi:hypothetical protein